MPIRDPEKRRAAQREAMARKRSCEPVNPREPVNLSSPTSEAPAVGKPKELPADMPLHPLRAILGRLNVNQTQLGILLGVGRSTASFELAGDQPCPSPAIVRGLEELGFDGDRYRFDYAAWYGSMRARLVQRAREALQTENDHDSQTR
jgi:hypothetical protein